MNAAHRPAGATRAGLASSTTLLASIWQPSLGVVSKAAYAFLAALLLTATPTLAADNFAINNATGTFTVISCTETAGVCTLNVATIPASGSDAAVSYVSSTTLTANQIIKAAAGNLYSFEVSADSTLSAAAWWIMIYDAVTAPADGAITPAKCYAMPSGTTGYAAAFPTPLRLATGITIGVSTAGCFTKTASTHAFISGDAK